MEYGVLKYDNLVLFSPNIDEYGGDVTGLKIANYVDNGGNVLVGLDSRVTDTVRATVAEFGVESDTEDMSVIWEDIVKYSVFQKILVKWNRRFLQKPPSHRPLQLLPRTRRR